MAINRSTRSVALKWWVGAGLLATLIAACATSSETRNAPASAPASAAAPEPAAPKPEAPSTAQFDDTDFATLEEAEAALERARADLDRLALLDRTPGVAAEAPAAAPAPPAASRAGSGGPGDTARSDKKAERARASKGKPAAEAEAKEQADEDAPAKTEDPCETGCKAFASLLRAKAAVCRLDTPGGARCTRAEDIARGAQSRVRSCACQQ